jgi:hypothetical protein
MLIVSLFVAAIFSTMVFEKKETLPFFVKYTCAARNVGFTEKINSTRTAFLIFIIFILTAMIASD